jgi:hypothetical protein
MTPKRTWLALGALLTAIVGGTIWAAEREKATPPAPAQGGVQLEIECRTTTDKKCCDEKCSTKDAAKTCCEGKCCAAEKGKGCCADGKCCGCCEKAKGTQAVTLPVPPGSAVQLMIAPNAAGMDFAMPFTPPPPPCVTVPCLPPQQSCGSPWGNPLPPPAPEPQLALPVPTMPVSGYPAYPATPCVAPSAARPAVSAWHLRVVVKNDHSSLVMQWDGDEDTRVSCDEMVLQVGQESLKVGTSGKQILVGGSFVSGTADAVSRNPNDGSLLLEGHVKMHYGKGGQKVDVAAEHVVVGAADGRIEVKGLGSVTAPKETRPASTTAPQCPLCPASANERQQLFNFGMGFFH